ncbi:hypothetical protein [Sporosarcina newyorkensis]|uniref:hypothetical protein n=1 Tax=Sporosarcina newyorkensis TaxID=759851 RepID=UPI003CFCF346
MKNQWRNNRLQEIQEHATKSVNDLITEAYAQGYEDGKAFKNHKELMDRITVPKSPNQQRAELIRRAREFVENIIGKYPNFEMDIDRFTNQAVSAKFHVNAEKRTVVALVHGYFSRKLVCKGIAKCMPGDVFNEWIGKAIALARALEIEVPVEFLEAVQPDKAELGMKIYPLFVGTNNRACTLKQTTRITHEGYPGYEDGRFSSHYEILDDTRAQYEVPS